MVHYTTFQLGRGYVPDDPHVTIDCIDCTFTPHVGQCIDTDESLQHALEKATRVTTILTTTAAYGKVHQGILTLHGMAK